MKWIKVLVLVCVDSSCIGVAGFTMYILVILGIHSKFLIS